MRVRTGRSSSDESDIPPLTKPVQADAGPSEGAPAKGAGAHLSHTEAAAERALAEVGMQVGA